MQEVSSLHLLLILLLLSVMAASFIQWIRLLWGHRSDLSALPEHLVPAQPRERPFWNPGDAMLMFGSLQVIVGLALAASLATGWVIRDEGGKITSGSLNLILLTIAAGVVASLITMAWLRHRERDFVNKLSLRLNDADGRLGLKAAVMILPPVLVINVLAAQLVKYEHPVLDSMAGLSDPLTFCLIFIGTAIVTPFVEEFLFRVLLQGGLERIADPSPAAETDSQTESNWRPRSHWPIVVSSLVFALMHVGQGAAPVPLFFLSLGLGFLYRQTGNITAPMVVHMALNATTIIVEAVRVMSES